MICEWGRYDMPGAKSSDLRWLVVEDYESGSESFAEVGERLKVGEASVSRWVQQFRQTWSVDPKPHGGGIKPHIPDERLDEFKAIIDEHPDAYLAELAELCTTHFGVSVSSASVVRACKRANITRKKRL
jgi:transposase